MIQTKNLKPCDHCSGNGRIPDSDPYRERTQMIDCPKCHGKKWLMPPELTVPASLKKTATFTAGPKLSLGGKP